MTALQSDPILDAVRKARSGLAEPVLQAVRAARAKASPPKTAAEFDQRYPGGTVSALPDEPPKGIIENAVRGAAQQVLPNLASFISGFGQRGAEAAAAMRGVAPPDPGPSGIVGGLVGGAAKYAAAAAGGPVGILGLAGSEAGTAADQSQRQGEGGLAQTGRALLAGGLAAAGAKLGSGGERGVGLLRGTAEQATANAALGVADRLGNAGIDAATGKPVDLSNLRGEVLSQAAIGGGAHLLSSGVRTLLAKDPDKAVELASKPSLSRTDISKNGLGARRTTQADRAAIQEQLKAGTTPATAAPSSPESAVTQDEGRVSQTPPSVGQEISDVASVPSPNSTTGKEASLEKAKEGRQEGLLTDQSPPARPGPDNPVPGTTAVPSDNPAGPGAALPEAKVPGGALPRGATGTRSGATPILTDVAQDVVNHVTGAAKAVAAVHDDILRIANPTARTPLAREAGNVIRENAAELAKRNERAEASLRELASASAKLKPNQRLDFIDRIETGSGQANPELQQAADTMRSMLDEARTRVQKLGTGKLEHFNQNYFPHLWQDPAKAGDVLGQIFGKRPLEGSKSFLKKRTIPTTADGIKAGLVPVTDNPIDLTMLKVREMNRYVMAHDILKEYKARGMAKFVKATKSAPDGYAKIDDRIATVHAPPDAEGTIRIRGHYYAPEAVARVLNNYLSPGLRGNAAYDAVRGVGNVMNQAQLGLSAFHLGMTSIDAAVSRTALGIRQLAAGKPLKAIRSFATTPVAPFTNLIQGNKVLKEYFKPGSQGGDFAQVVDALTAGGGRVKMDSFYHNSSAANFWDAFQKGHLLTAARRSVPAVIESLAKPIMEYLVPRQKVGVFTDLARLELEKLPPDATRAQVRDVMGPAWDSVDNRMGQLVYDNLFWDKTLKDVAMATVRSVGWNLGTFRELGGGAIDIGRMMGKAAMLKKPELSNRAAYSLALPVVTGIVGAITNYLYTGKGPQSWRDLYFPLTGRKNPDGTDERLTLPSYMKDVFAFQRHPLATVGHKLHPAAATAIDMLMNRDFYGNEIRNPQDPIVQQVQQEMGYVAKSFLPFSVRNITEEGDRGQSAMTKALGFVGVTAAPKEVIRSAAQNRLAEISAASRAVSTPLDQAQSMQARSAIEKAIRGGKDPAPLVEQAIAAGTITEKQALETYAKAKKDPWIERFKRLPVEQAQQVFDLGTPDEQAGWKGILGMKRLRADIGELEAKRKMGALQPGELSKLRRLKIRESALR